MSEQGLLSVFVNNKTLCLTITQQKQLRWSTCDTANYWQHKKVKKITFAENLRKVDIGWDKS